jgi:D-glycero-alpha-D-manno-heptose-7-phosphate kinase
MLISRAPLRISFFGGGTDYPEHFLSEGGAVLASAIDKCSYVTASPFFSQLFDYSVRLAYRKVELVRQVSDIEHNVFRECLKHCGLERDIELHAVADLPAFTGLGSSSSFTVALLHSLHCFKGEYVTPLKLAYEAIYLERKLLNEAVGCQDQVLAAVGGFNLIEFKREDDVSVYRLPLRPSRIEELESHLLLVFTGIKRRAVDVAAAQLGRVEANRPTLRIMRRLVDQGCDLLLSDQSLTRFGALLHDSWTAKRELDDGVSTRVVDEMYAMALENGAVGGKLLGAGGGGFLMLFAPPELHPRLKSTFKDHQLLSVRLNAPGSQIIFASDREPVTLPARAL